MKTASKQRVELETKIVFSTYMCALQHLNDSIAPAVVYRAFLHFKKCSDCLIKAPGLT